MSGMITDWAVISPPAGTAPPPVSVEPTPTPAAPIATNPALEPPAAPITDFVVAAPSPAPAPVASPSPVVPAPSPSLSATMLGTPPPEDSGEGFLSGIFAGNRAAGRDLRRTMAGQAFEIDPNAPVEPEHRTFLNELGYGFGRGTPAIGAGLVGGAVGAAAGSAVPVIGTGIGGAVGAGIGVAGMTVAQELAPAYAAARAQGMDHDAAVDYAWTRGGTTGAVSGLFGMIPGGKTIIGNLLLQAGVVQPASGAATRTVVPLVTGEPLPSGAEYLRGFGQDVASGAAFAGGHAAARSVNRLAMGRELPLSPEVLAAQQRAAQEQAAEQQRAQQQAAEQQATQQGAPQQPAPVITPPALGQEQGVPPGERTRLTIDEPTGAPDVEVAPVTVRPTEPAGAPEPGAVPGGRLEPTEPGVAPVTRGPEIPGDATTERPGQEPPLGETGPAPVEPTAPAGPRAPTSPEGAGPAPTQPAGPAAPVERVPVAPVARDEATVRQNREWQQALLGRADGTVFRGTDGKIYRLLNGEIQRQAPDGGWDNHWYEGQNRGALKDLSGAEVIGNSYEFPPGHNFTEGAPAGPPRFRTEPDDAHPGQHVAKDESGAVVGKGATPDEAAGDALRRGGQPYPPEQGVPVAEETRPVAAEPDLVAAEPGVVAPGGDETLPVRPGDVGSAEGRPAAVGETPETVALRLEGEARPVAPEVVTAGGTAVPGAPGGLPEGAPAPAAPATRASPQLERLRATRDQMEANPNLSFRESLRLNQIRAQIGNLERAEARAAAARAPQLAEISEITANAKTPETGVSEVSGRAPEPGLAKISEIKDNADRSGTATQLERLRATRDQMEANPNLSFRDSIRLNQIRAQIDAQERAQQAQTRTQEREMRTARSQAEAQAAARGDTSGPRIGGIKRPYREPMTGRKPDFYDYQYADGTSVYRSVFEEAGHDPDVATNWPVQRQNEVLSNHLKNKFGYSSVEIVGARGQPATQVDQRMARDFMLDLTRATTDMFAALNYPLDAASLGGRLRIELVPEGKTPWLGQYAWGSNNKVIRVQSGANSYGHEWTHALDHQLTERFTQDPAGLMKLLTMHAREGTPPLDVKDPVQLAFAKVINAMFFDKQAMALRQLSLENTALKVGPNGQPTAVAMNARRQLALLEAGGSLLHMQPTEFRVRSASLGDPAYWASAHEMLARAHEAYIARQMQQAGVNPRGVVMPDAAYSDTTSRMLANAYPKTGELEHIFAAFNELHHAMRNEQVLGSGPPAKWASYGISDPHYWPVTAPQTKGNFLTRPIRREIESYRGFTQKALQAWPFDPDRPKGPLSLPTQLADGFRAVAYSARGLMQTFIERAPPGAQPHLQKILDLLTTDPATGRYTPENFEEAWKSSSREWHRRMGNILGANGLNPERMSVEQGLMLRHIMTEGDPRAFPVDVADPSKGTKPVPANIVKAAGDMRYLFEDIWTTLRRAGFDIGFAKNGYYPRMYDVYKVFDNPAGFETQARELHRLMFDREVASDPGAMVEQWTQLSGPNRKQAPPGISAEIGKLRRNLRRQAELEGNPARTPVEDAELLKLKTDADTIAQTVHDPLGDHVAAVAAAEWYARFLNGGVHDFDAMGPSSGFMKARTLPPEADRIMRDYMYTDPRVALPQYFQSAARRLAFGERFGTKGEELQRLLDEARAAPGANPHDIAEFESYANLIMGRMNNHAQTRRSMKIASAVGALGQVALMPRAAWSSLTEPMAANLVTGDMRTGLKIIANQFGQLFGGRSALERTQLAEYLGVTTSAMHDSVMLSRNNADYSNTPAINRLLTHFYRITGLTQLTNSQRVGTTASSSWYLGKLAHDYLNQGVGTRARNARDDATRWFNELGVHESNHREFAEWMRDLNGALPSIHRLQVDPMGSVYGLAVRRMVDRIIQDPTKADRPAISHGAFGSLVAQLMNFNYSFQKNVLTPMFMRIEHAYGRAKVNAVNQGAGAVGATTAGLVAGAGAVSHAAAMAGSVLAAGFMTTMLRQYLFAPDQWTAHSEKDDLEDWLLGLTFARAGFNGTLDPLIQVASNLRYNSDLTDLVDGATLRWASQNAMDVIAPFVRDQESPNSNTQYYNQARGAFNLIGVPLAAIGLSMLGAGGGMATRIGASAALQYGTSARAAGGFAATVAGDKGTKLPKETESLGDLPNMGDLGTLGNLTGTDKDAEEAGGMVTPWGLIDDMIAPAWRYTAPWLNRLGIKTKVGGLVAGAGYGVWDYLDKTAPYREASEAARP